MSTDLVRRDELTNLSILEMQSVAQLLADSGFFGDKGKGQAQAFVAVLAGQELGIPPFAAIKGIHIIQGRPEVGADLLAAMVKNSDRYDYRVTSLDDTACSIDFFEHGDHVGGSKFTIDDAKKAGLLGNKTWQQYPRNMLFARAMSNGVSWHCPDVTHGRVYVEGEIPDSTPRPPAPPHNEPVAAAPTTAPVTEPEVVVDAEVVSSTPNPEPVAPTPVDDSPGDAGTAPAEPAPTARSIADVRKQFEQLSQEERDELNRLMLERDQWPRDEDGEIKVGWPALILAMETRKALTLDGLMDKLKAEIAKAEAERKAGAERFQAAIDTNTTDDSLQGSIDTNGLASITEDVGTIDDAAPKGRRKLTPKAPA